MTARNSAALVLVGWYLIAAPSSNNSDWDRIKQHVWGAAPKPLSEWTVVQAFDSAKGCEAKREEQVDDAARKEINWFNRPDYLSAQASSELEKAVTVRKLTLLCVSSDDPRLKGQ